MTSLQVSKQANDRYEGTYAQLKGYQNIRSQRSHNQMSSLVQLREFLSGYSGSLEGL